MEVLFEVFDVVVQLKFFFKEVLDRLDVVVSDFFYFFYTVAILHTKIFK